MERTICWQNDDASISKRSIPSPRSTQRASRTTRTSEPPGTGGRRQKEEKSCSPNSGSQASRMAARSRGRATCQAVPAVKGSATGWLRTV